MDLYVDYFPVSCNLALLHLDMVFPQGWICWLIIVKWHANVLMVCKIFMLACWFAYDHNKENKQSSLAYYKLMFEG